jgi:RNA polymerase sigma-70 factor (ECF subfamily)
MSEQHTTQPREGQPPLDELLGERQHLLNVAFRMLGAMNDAEDVVQETYARWFRLEEAERERIEIPAAWLTRVAARICLDVLGSARHRREQYVGEWLPEPTPETRVGAGTVTADPLERVTLDDSVTMALLVVLESLTPAERVAFVLHDVFALPFEEIAEIVGRTPQACRKLASSARRHVRDGRAREVSPAVHTRTVRAFWDACQTGDVTALLAVLDPDVVARSDGGGRVSAALNPVVGADRTARFLLGVLAKSTDVVPSMEPVAGRTGVVFRREGVVSGTASFNIRGGRIVDVWITLNPDKLTAWAGR